MHFITTAHGADACSLKLGGEIDDAFTLTLIITGAFFVVINLLIAWIVIRYRHKPGRKSTYQPDNKKLEAWLIGLTAIGIVALLAPGGLVVYGKFVNVPDEAQLFEVVGEQWKWSFRFPGKDNQLGQSGIQFVTPTNPLGLDPDDPASADDKIVLSPELHLPLFTSFKVLLRSKDVLHDFNVPQFRAKMDLVPGTITYFWFTPTQRGTFDILCAELCGIGHFNMRGRVVVEDDATFGVWLASQRHLPTASSHRPPAASPTLSNWGGRLSLKLTAVSPATAWTENPGVGPTWLGLYGKTERMSDDAEVVVDDAYLRTAILNAGGAEVVKGYPRHHAGLSV